MKGKMGKKEEERRKRKKKGEKRVKLREKGSPTKDPDDKRHRDKRPRRQKTPAIEDPTDKIPQIIPR